MNKNKTINLGEIGAKVAIFQSPHNKNNRYVLHADGLEAYFDWSRDQSKTDAFKYQYGYIQDHLFEDEWETSKFFICCNVDCFSPPMFLVRADSFESAYEVFVEDFGERACGFVDLPTRNESETDEEYWTRCEAECDSPRLISGGLIDTALVQIHETKLLSVEY